MPFILPIFRLGSVLQLESEPAVEQIGDTPGEVPFAISEKWKWVQLNNVTTQITDGTHHSPVSFSKGDPRGKFLYVTAKNIKFTGVDCSTATYVTEDAHNEITSRCLPKFRDVLYIKDGATTGVVTVNNIEEPFSLLSSVALIRPIKLLLDPYFLSFTLRAKSMADLMRGKMKGTGIPRVTLKIIKKFSIPLPPLEEQHRIITKINQLFAQIDCAEKAYNELSGPLSERFRQLCLEKAIQGKLVPQLESEPEVEQVGDAPEDVPFAIPEKWKWVNLHSTLKAISDGSHNPPPNVGHGVPVLSAKNVINGIIDTNSVTRWTTEEQWSIEDKKIHIQSGDVLLTIVGTIGRTAVVPNDCEKFMLQRSVCVMKPKECVNPEFLALILNSPSLFEWIMDHASGTAQKGIYLKTVKQIPIPLPSIEEQRRIVAKLNELLGSISQLEQTISTP